MESFYNFLIGDFARLAPYVAGGVVLVLAVWLYHRRAGARKYWYLIWGYIGFKALYALVLSWGQYHIWTQSPFTRYFLESPLSSDVPNNFVTNLLPWLYDSEKGFFIFYVIGRFWYNLMVLFIVAFAFWLLLKALKKHKERFFDTGEVELGLLTALLAGWPGFLIYVPFVFGFVVVVSIVRMVVFKQALTTLGIPFLLGGATAFIWGKELVKMLGLGVFII